MSYAINKRNARTFNDMPSATDQAGAKDTDINIIVEQHDITGRAPGSATPPRTGDFTNLPQDLRSMIETARSIGQLRRSLPAGLRDKPMEQLLTLTPDELTNILTPPAPKPEEDKTK